MAKNIYLVGGSKGGVGKSLVTMAVVDLLESMGESACQSGLRLPPPPCWPMSKPPPIPP